MHAICVEPTRKSWCDPSGGNGAVLCRQKKSAGFSQSEDKLPAALEKIGPVSMNFWGRHAFAMGPYR